MASAPGRGAPFLRIRRGLARARSRASWLASSAMAGAVGGVVSVLPARARVRLRERMDGSLGLVRPMDYRPSDVLLHVDSMVELETRLRSCAKEPETVDWIETHIRAGDVVYDIGANVGVYSLVIDRHTGGGAWVYAFEPGVSTFLQLTRNFALNSCGERIIALPVAFGAETRMATFNYSSLAPGAARHAMGEEAVDALGQPFEPAMRQRLLQYRLDDFAKLFGLESPNHIKLDVDGPELDILHGARRTLRDPGLRSVMVELEPTSEAADRGVAMLEEAGLGLVSVHSHGAATETSNYLFVRT